MGDKDCGDPVTKSQKMSSALDQLKHYTTVVADTGDFEGKWACQIKWTCRTEMSVTKHRAGPKCRSFPLERKDRMDVFRYENRYT